MRSVGESDTVSPRPGVEQLGDVDPDETSPGEAVRNDEEVDEDGHPDGSPRRTLSVPVRGVGVEDGTDHHQEDSHTQGTGGRNESCQPGAIEMVKTRADVGTHPKTKYFFLPARSTPNTMNKAVATTLTNP